MSSPDLLLAFLAATALFAYMPGPSMLYAAAQTVARGRTAGLKASLGIHLGGYVHVVAAAGGLSVLFHVIPALYVAVKVVGAIYLVWLGLAMIHSATKSESSTRLVTSGRAKSARHAFLESIAVEVLNPKTAIFFLAFLPQFVEPAGSLPVWVQLMVLGTVVNLAFSSADLLCVWFAGAIVEGFRRTPRTGRIMECIGGSLLVGLGAHLAFQRS
ncbi:MAG: LysE family translocator [Gammaproteobacteria bacterium]